MNGALGVLLLRSERCSHRLLEPRDELCDGLIGIGERGRPCDALIGRLSLRADGEWLAELLIDLEEDEPARMQLIDALRQIP